MGDGNPNNNDSKARERAAAAAISMAIAQARKKRADAQADYEKSTDGLHFTKDFNSHLEALMRDRLNTHGERFLAWLKRYSWGEWALFAIDLNGEPRGQADAASELGIDKKRISDVVDYLETRGYLYRDGRKLYPVISPQTGPDPEKVRSSPDFRAFFEKWKVRCSSDFHELEVARSTVKRIRKVLLSEYKKSEEYATKRAATLLKIARKLPDGAGAAASSKSSTPYEESQQRAKKKEQQRQAQEAEMQFDARAFLFSEIQRMQLSYPKSTFAQPAINRQNPAHEQLLNLLVKKLGRPNDEPHYMGFVIWVAAEFKGLGPGKRPRIPESLGLLANWAEDYAAACRAQEKREAAGA